MLHPWASGKPMLVNRTIRRVALSNPTRKTKTPPTLGENEPRHPSIACKSLFIPLQAMLHFRLSLSENGILNI